MDAQLKYHLTKAVFRKMRFLVHFDKAGARWYEVVSRSYARLNELRQIYHAEGFRTWLNPFDGRRWILTVRGKTFNFMPALHRPVIDISENYLSFGLTDASKN
jgi:hypothetical protein